MDNKLAIIDASLVIKAILPNPDLTRCQSILTRLIDRQLIAPALWIYEVTSALTKAVYFNLLTVSEGRAALDQAMALGVQVILPDMTQAHLSFDQTIRLNRVAAYDCFYLSTAEALNADLWTADKRIVSSFQNKKPDWLHYIDEA